MTIYTFSVSYVRSMLEVTLDSKHKLLYWATYSCCYMVYIYPKQWVDGL
jgi:hypothetical protein